MANLYTPFKTIGCVCDSNKFLLNRFGDQTFITTTIGRRFQV
jgi:hypothetical protein